MILEWLFAGALVIVDWILDRFQALGLPNVTWPAALNLVVPIPLLGVHATALNTFFATAVLVATALLVGRVLQWLYRLLPFNG